MGEITDCSDPVDELLGLLQSRRRRLVIYYLRNRTESEPVRVETLASAIAAMEMAEAQPWENTEESEEGLTQVEAERNAEGGLVQVEPGGEPEADRTDHVRISLVHIHLPKLDENGVVAYDFATGTVRATHPPDEFWERLRSCQRFSAGLAATEVE